LALICRDGDCTEGAMAVNRLSLALEKVEPKNVPLFLENAQVGEISGERLPFET